MLLTKNLVRGEVKMLSQDQFFDLVRQRLGQELNDQQAACVATPARALLIIAGPGTGKTTTMVVNLQSRCD
jgi:ATP-dependent exoDNAse (exonuclease V) alpha subunit